MTECVSKMCGCLCISLAFYIAVSCLLVFVTSVGQNHSFNKKNTHNRWILVTRFSLFIIFVFAVCYAIYVVYVLSVFYSHLGTLNG